MEVSVTRSRDDRSGGATGHESSRYSTSYADEATETTVRCWDSLFRLVARLWNSMFSRGSQAETRPLTAARVLTSHSTPPGSPEVQAKKATRDLQLRVEPASKAPSERIQELESLQTQHNADLQRVEEMISTLLSQPRSERRESQLKELKQLQARLVGSLGSVAQALATLRGSMSSPMRSSSEPSSSLARQDSSTVETGPSKEVVEKAQRRADFYSESLVALEGRLDGFNAQKEGVLLEMGMKKAALGKVEENPMLEDDAHEALVADLSREIAALGSKVNSLNADIAYVENSIRGTEAAFEERARVLESVATDKEVTRAGHLTFVLPSRQPQVDKLKAKIAEINATLLELRLNKEDFEESAYDRSRPQADRDIDYQDLKKIRTEIPRQKLILADHVRRLEALQNEMAGRTSG